MFNFEKENFHVMLTKEQTINEIVREVKKLDKLELQILLTRLRVKKVQKEKRKTVANVNTAMQMPSLQDIDQWKHQSRK